MIKSTLVTIEILPEQSATTVIRSSVIAFFWGRCFLSWSLSGQWLHVILSHSILYGCCVAVRLSLRLLPSLIKQPSVKMKRKAKKKASFDSENIQFACFPFDKSELLHGKSQQIRTFRFDSYVVVELNQRLKQSTWLAALVSSCAVYQAIVMQIWMLNSSNVTYFKQSTWLAGLTSLFSGWR